MAKLPKPDLATIRSVAPVYAERHETLWRAHLVLGDHPLMWNDLRRHGPLPSARFDPWPPPPQDRETGAGYFAFDVATCLAEVFQETRRINAREPGYQLSAFTPTRALSLLDLRGDYPIQMGASHTINGGHKNRCRQWACALATVHPDADGMLFHAMTGKDCLVLWEPGSDAFGEAPDFSRPLQDRGLARTVATAAQHINYLYIP